MHEEKHPLPDIREVSFDPIAVTQGTVSDHAADLLRAAAERRSTRVYSLNLGKLALAERDPAVASMLNAAEVRLADGQGLVWLGWLLGRKCGPRAAGIDVMTALLDRMPAKGVRPYFLGARPDVVSAMVTRLKAHSPDLDVAGYHDGYQTVDPEALSRSGADILFVALPSPQKEELIHKLHESDVGIPVLMAVGGSFDVLSGRLTRAPKWMQRIGFEWSYRLVLEPRRLWWRYWDSFCYLVRRVAFRGPLRTPRR